MVPEKGWLKGRSMTENRVTVSIIVLTYNAPWSKVKITLDSIMKQQGIDYEILVTDDGSSENHQKKLTEYFAEHGFENYQLVLNPANQGTVRNYLSGLHAANGRYAKAIGQGDLLANQDTLCKWVAFLESEKAQWSFSDARMFREDPKQLISVEARPQLIRPYLRHDENGCRWNYVVLSDIALGATMLGERELQEHYCQILADHGVVYAEDNMWRLMMFEGIVGSYYPETTVLYEYGTGVSAEANEKWHVRLVADWKKTDQVMAEKAEKSAFQIKMLEKAGATGWLSKIMTRGKLKLWIKRHTVKRKTAAE